MASLYISEYAGMGRMTGRIGDEAPVGQEASLDQAPVAIGAASVQSAAFKATTRFVWLSTDAICSVVFGADPVATANNKRLPAGWTGYFAVPPGQDWKVAVITNV